MDLRFLLLLACFFLSGFAALLYQTAWTRELSFVFGTSELAVAVVLASYMAGLALGALAAARYMQRVLRPVLAYGVLELGIAVCALLVPLAIQLLNFVYLGVLRGDGALPESPATAATIFQLGAAFAVLLPPTALMGATLPLLARDAVRSSDEIGSRVGTLYAVNTAGAIAGTLCAAFLLMPELGLRRTVWAGAGCNALVFGLAAWLARASAGATAPDTTSALPSAESAGKRAAEPADARAAWILPAIGLSGAVSFAYEVTWTRLLGHVLGASTHAFATMLASFLLGITLGSAAAARFATTKARAILGFALAQLGIAFSSYAAFALADRLPELSAWLGAGPGAHLSSVGVSVATLLPTTFCIGATFPFAVRAATDQPAEAAHATARVYAWNTAGAIVGSLGAGLYLLPELGFAGTMSLAIACNLGLAIVAALGSPMRRWALAGLAGAMAAGLGAFALETPLALLSSSPFDPERAGRGEVHRVAVGRSTTVMLLERGGRYQLTTGGLPESWILSRGMLPELGVADWLGALPALLRPETRDLLVIGLGGGGMIERAPASYETIDVVELEPEVVAANRSLGARRAIDPLADPRVRVVIGDARGTLQLVDKQYDAIASQPSHPWTAGASHLYTREFFSLVQSRLSPQGVFVQWIGMRFVDEPLLGSLLAALRESFPHVNLFQPRHGGLLFFASNAPIDVLGAISRSIETAPDEWARRGVYRPEDIASAWVLDEAGLAELADGAAPNSDDHNLLAARSAQLGEKSLNRDTSRALFGRHDPLASAQDLDGPALVRSLLRRGQAKRAEELAVTFDAADEEAALGWFEVSQGRPGRASRHFEQALRLEPSHPDALDGWVASKKLTLTIQPGLSRAPAEKSPFELGPAREAVVKGWRLALNGNWEQMRSLEPALARIAPGSGLFGAAARLRAGWRLADGSDAEAEEALALAEGLLLRGWSAEDEFLRARAALRAGQSDAAWGSLARLSFAVQSAPQGSELQSRILAIAKDLPAEQEQQIRRHLKVDDSLAENDTRGPKGPKAADSPVKPMLPTKPASSPPGS